MPEAHQFRIIRKPQGISIFFTIANVHQEGSYHIYPLSSLGACLTGTRRSAWVHQLAEKAWATLPLLYELAFHIRQLQPQNQIDWVETFVPIEEAYAIARQAEPHPEVTTTPGRGLDLLKQLERRQAMAEQLEITPAMNQPLRELVIRKLSDSAQANLP